MTAQEVDGGSHLINVFSVPKGKEDDFVKWWEDVKATITVQQGVRERKVLPKH